MRDFYVVLGEVLALVPPAHPLAAALRAIVRSTRFRAPEQGQGELWAEASDALNQWTYHERTATAPWLPAVLALWNQR